MAQNYQLQKTGQEIDALLQKIDGLDVATDESSGLMSAQDKSKLDGIESGAEENLIEAIVLGDQSLSPSGSKTVTIPMDDVPAMGSNNPVKSGGVYTALAGINEKIPSEASASNKLADKGYVDESISTSSATYISNNGQPFASLADLQAYTGAHDKNDYAYVVGTDAAGNTVYNRYKFDGTNWAFEYAINNTAFTTSQWNTINSGMVAADKTKLDALPNNETLQEDLDEKAKKVSGATAGNLAALDESGNLKDAGIAAEKVAQKGEIQAYSGNLVDTRSAGTAQEFTYRKSGGDGVNWMRRIKGKSLVWNQLFSSSESVTQNGIVITKNSDGSITASGTCDAGTKSHASIRLMAGLYFYGHQIYIAGAPRGSSFTTRTQVNTVQTYALWLQYWGSGDEPMIDDNGYILSSATDSYYILNLVVKNGESIDATFYPQIHDLTLMFGEGKEPSTVAEFEALYNEIYYHYQPGVIKNNDAVAMESVGFNQWDEEWEHGIWDLATGNKADDNDFFRSKNYIAVFPETAYHFYRPSSYSTIGAILFYDANKTYLGQSSAISLTTASLTFTTPSNCRFITFRAFGTTYKNDICINISDASRNGTYEPYWKKSIQLGLNAFRVTDGTNIITVNGLKSAGSVYDEIDPVRKKYIKRIGEVDLGTLEWNISGSGDSVRFVATVNGIKTVPESSVGNLICSKYLASAIQNIASIDKVVMAHPSASVVWIKDTSYSTAEAFAEAMSGVYLYYELATPIEYDLVDDIPNAIEVDENGTERAIFPEAVDPSAPFAADSNYSVSTANLVRKLNDAS